MMIRNLLLLSFLLFSSLVSYSYWSKYAQTVELIVDVHEAQSLTAIYRFAQFAEIISAELLRRIEDR